MNRRQLIVALLGVGAAWVSACFGPFRRRERRQERREYHQDRHENRQDRREFQQDRRERRD